MLSIPVPCDDGVKSRDLPCPIKAGRRKRNGRSLVWDAGRHFPAPFDAMGPLVPAHQGTEAILISGAVSPR
jgi:hypothetical protein